MRIVEAFDLLPQERKKEIFRGLSAAAREGLLGVCSRPAALLRSISPEEIYYSVKELGEEEAVNLVTYSTGSQLTYMLDVDLWKKDMFDPVAARRWLETIGRISEDKIVHFLQVSDPELIVTALHPFVKVHVVNPDLDLVEQRDTLPPFTLDDIFFVEFKIPDSEDMMRRILETVFLNDVERYFGIMEELCHGLVAENEETALKWRRARLADKGFPDFDEATEIYHYLHKTAVVEDPFGEEETDRTREENALPLTEFPLKVIDRDNILKRCLDRLEESSERDRLATELAHLGNKVMVADGRDPGSFDQLEGSLHKVVGYINMALEETCGDDIERGLSVLSSNHMEILFRRGFSLIMDLRKDAHRLIRDRDGGTENLGYPLAGMLDGLLKKRPTYAGHLLGEKNSREFQYIEDIHYIRELMERVETGDQWESI